jgi:hypothetical protein
MICQGRSLCWKLEPESRTQMEFQSFWDGVLAGYGIAIPVGAIAVLIIDVSIRRGLAIGMQAGAGAATADLIYASGVPCYRRCSCPWQTSSVSWVVGH